MENDKNAKGPKPKAVPEFVEPAEVGPRDWGEEILLVLASGKYIGKKLVMKAGAGGGLQKHHLKDETTYILSGEYEFTYDPGDGSLVKKTLSPGDCVRIPPGAVHQGIALTDCTIIEFSTPHFNDRVRLEEDYGLDKGDGLPSTRLEDVEER